MWRTNVDGTAAVLAALPRLPGVAAFNYISTAYVAGDRQGEILEDERARPLHFNNPYEDSKWVAEGLVRDGCAAAGTAWRIMRPSIIIAHSVTYRMSSHSGFYQVMDTLLQLGRQPRLAGAGPILLPVTTGTTLDLIPVDVVVDEVVALIAAGGATAGRTFHITGADPLRARGRAAGADADERRRHRGERSGHAADPGRQAGDAPAALLHALLRLSPGGSIAAAPRPRSAPRPTGSASRSFAASCAPIWCSAPGRWAWTPTRDRGKPDRTGAAPPQSRKAGGFRAFPG